MPLRRYALAALLALAGLVAIMLVIRPLIFSLAPARGDANYAVAATAEVARPIHRDLLLAASHGLRGERPQEGGHVAISIVVAPLPGGGYSVVNATSPESGCPVTIGADRLVDCRGRGWTYDGTPIGSGQPPLQRFPVAVRSGAVIVDFTRPYSAPPAAMLPGQSEGSTAGGG
ncbi:MAG: hypothetical protein M3Y88_05725 [Chloroflexota bacterium]|nr:hypothetical protein [Chloroflexota bacterium]